MQETITADPDRVFQSEIQMHEHMHYILPKYHFNVINNTTSV